MVLSVSVVSVVSSFWFLILLIWDHSFFLPRSKVLSILFIFSKDFIFLIFLCVFTVFRVFTAAWGFSIVALCRLLTVEASLIAEHGLWGTWTSVAVASRL